MSEEEFEKIENPTYSDYVKRYGDFANFMYATKSYENGGWNHPLALMAIVFGVMMVLFVVLMSLA
jgi:hypothetical protein